MDRASFDRQLEKGFDAQEVSTELAPGSSSVHVLTEESEHPEYRYLRQERICMGGALQVAVAAQFGHCAVLNPANSNTLLVVPDFYIINTGAASRDYHIRSGTISGTSAFTAVPGFLCDSRYGPTATVRATGLLGVLTAATLQGALIGRAQVPAGDTFLMKGPWVLAPGTWVGVARNLVNEECKSSFRWWERYAESGELQGAGV